MLSHIGEVALKQLAGPLDREQFDHIDMLAAAVIAAARIALRRSFVSTEPAASNTARLTIFSDAINSISSL